MPRDGTLPAEPAAAAATLDALADFLETLDPALLDLRTVHHACGTAHCAWGWGETIGLLPRAAPGAEADAAWAAELASARRGRSRLLGLTEAQFRDCFGMGYQFRHLGRPYGPADVARRLRRAAAALAAGRD